MGKAASCHLIPGFSLELRRTAYKHSTRPRVLSPGVSFCTLALRPGLIENCVHVDSFASA